MPNKVFMFFKLSLLILGLKPPSLALAILGKENLVNIEKMNPSIILDIRYATSDTFLKTPAYSKAVCYLTKDAADAINEVQKDLQSQGLCLKIFDGYRPLFVQQKMWDLIQDERYVSNPVVNKGRHTRGTAVDVTIVKDGMELLMPTPFDDFSEKASSTYMDLPLSAINNIQLLKDIMEKHGFTQLASEWWHFDLNGWQDDFKYPALNFTFEEMECN